MNEWAVFAIRQLSAKAIEIEDVEARIAELEKAAEKRNQGDMRTATALRV